MSANSEETGNVPATGSALPTEVETGTVRIPVWEEQLVVDTDWRETGRLRVTKTVHESEQTVDVALIREEFNVERVAVNQYVDAAPAVRYEGDTTIVPVLKEVLVVEKRLMLVEEIRIVKRQITSSDTQQVTLRREEVTVAHVANEAERPAD